MTTETVDERVDLDDADETIGLGDLENDPAYASQQPRGEEVARSSHALFFGDRGELSESARRALVRLLKDRFVSAEDDPQEWAALLENEDAIVSRLNDLFLVLSIDRERECAWKDQATPDGGGKYPTLLYRQRWNREATIALVYLRRLQAQSASAGRTTTFVDREAVLSAIDAARPAGATDHVADARRAEKALDDIYSAGLLIGRKTDDRFKVSRAIEALMSVDQLSVLLRDIEQGATAHDDDRATTDEKTACDAAATNESEPQR